MKLSFIIPTLNRSFELNRLLGSFVIQTRKPDEIIIIDQGGIQNGEMVKEYNLPIKYLPVNFRSLTRARNLGIRECSGDIVCFLDDDIVLAIDYVEKIANFFAANPTARGVQGVIVNFEEGHTKKVGGNKYFYIAYNILAKFFLLNHSSSTNRLLWSGRNKYASRADKVTTCQWLSGIGNYRRDVFNEFLFDENLGGYALGEDKLFSYQIFEKYPGSLFVDPQIRCEHYHPPDGAGSSREWVEMKIMYTYYLWVKLFRYKGILAYLSYLWANFGDLVIVFLSVLLQKNSWKFFLWHIQSYFRLIINSRK